MTQFKLMHYFDGQNLKEFRKSLWSKKLKVNRIIKSKMKKMFKPLNYLKCDFGGQNFEKIQQVICGPNS